MPKLASRQAILVLLAGAIVVVVGVPQAERLAADRDLLKPYDFVQYWSAGRLLLDGGNPYDPDQLVPKQREMYDGVRKAIMMWNPPWTLPLTLPFAALPWRLAQFLWLGMQLGAVLLSADMLWRIFGGDERQRWIAWLVALTFAPTLFLLLMGQISGLPLLGISGFLFFMRKDRPWLAGCFASLTAIKPHLLPLFALILLLESTRQRQIRKAILAGGCCLLIGALLPLAWNSQVWTQYLDAMGRPPSENFETMREFEHPTIGYWLRMQLPGQPFGAQFIPVAFALVAVGVYWLIRRESWTWDREMPMLVLVSVVAAGYGAWAFDLVLLLIPVMQMTAWLMESKQTGMIVLSAGAYLLLNFLVLRTIREAGSQSNPWIAPAVLVAYAVAWLGISKTRSRQQFSRS